MKDKPIAAGKSSDEVDRVLKPEGCLAIMEFQKIPDSPGPPLEIRIWPEEVQDILRRNFFTLKTSLVGPYNYLSLLTRKRKR